jgi:hypothetical protein
VFEPPSEVADAFAAVYQRVVPEGPFELRSAGPTLDAYQALFARAADGTREVGGFGEPEQWRFDGARTYTRDEWLDQLPTSGALTWLPPDTLAEVLAGVGAAIDAIGAASPCPTPRWRSPPPGPARTTPARPPRHGGRRPGR